MICRESRCGRRDLVDAAPVFGLLTRQNKTETMFVFRSFKGRFFMFRAVVEEAAALASISLFIGMIAVWAQVFSTF